MSEEERKPTIIKNPPKMWNPGDQRVEEFMYPVAQAIMRYHEFPSSEFTDIYNRAYEAVLSAIRKYDTGALPEIKNNLPKFGTVGEAKYVAAKLGKKIECYANGHRMYVWPGGRTQLVNAPDLIKRKVE